MEHSQANVGVRLTIELPISGARTLNAASSDAGGGVDAGGDASEGV
jgi:hypothetical protein